MKYYIFLFILFPISVVSQEHFKVEFAAFSPSDQQVIESLKGKSAEQFLAKDVSGEEVSLFTSPNKIKLLWFWSSEDPSSMALLPHLNLLQLDEVDDIWVYGFSLDLKDSASKVYQEQALIFSVIPNSGPIGELAYGGDLGNNRMFIIDKNRIINEVLPRSFFTERQPQEAISIIRDLIQRLKID